MSYANYSALGQMDIGTAVLRIAQDPHLKEVVCQVLRLNALERGVKAPPPCAQIPETASPGKGIGLRYAVKPLRMFVTTREKPYLIPLVVGGTALGVLLLGFFLGRGSKKGAR